MPRPFAGPRWLGASLRWDPIRRPPCRSRTRHRASQAFRLLGPRPRIGSPVVVPDSVALGQLSKPLGAQPSNPWTVTGLVRLSLSRVQEEPPSLRTEREGGLGSSRLFCPSPSRPFRSDGGCLPSPLACEPEPLGLGKVAGGAPESLARSERAVRGPPGFWFAPRA